MNKTLPEGKTVLCLRTVDENRMAYGGFQYPELGYVAAPDFLPTAKCGAGLHALLKGEGNGRFLSRDKLAIWQIVEVLESEIIYLNGKVKFPRCNVIFSGSKEIALEKIKSVYPNAQVVFIVSTSGDYGKSTSGDYGKSTSGYNGQSTSGDNGQSTSGDNGQSTSGDNGQSTSGYNGQSTSGYNGKSTSGDYGQSTSGDNGQSTSGDNGILEISYWYGKRKRIAIGYIGENGLLPNVPYKLNANFNFVEVK